VIVQLITRAWLAAAPPSDPLGPVNQDPDAVREEACKVVSSDKSVCSAPKPPKPPSSSSGGKGFDLSIVSLLLWVLFIAAVAGLLFMLLRWAATKSGRWSRRSTADDSADADTVERDVVAIDRSREPTNWRAEAEQHRQAGRYRDALRCRYRALVGDLARRGLIDEIPGRTTGEERAQLRRVTPTASSPFNSAADLFDGAWYGHREVSATDDDHFQTLERDVLATATQGRK
jgi:hypothetical protein